MTKTIAIFGGSFSPPGIHHRQMAEELAKHFDEVVVVPHGPRADKIVVNDVDPIYRATMTDLAFRGLNHVAVDLEDLEQSIFRRTHILQEKYASRGEIWHVVGTDLITEGRNAKSFIHRVWENGSELWNTYNFVVITRAGSDWNPRDLPPRHKLIPLNFDASSIAIREKLFRREPFSHLITEDVGRYIERYGLYRGRIPNRVTKINLESPQLLVVCDDRNPKALAWSSQFDKYRNDDHPNCILVIGGDGTMLHAIQNFWRLRLPFFGINAGHLGFLMNDATDILHGGFPPNDVVLRQMPLLYVESLDTNGEWKTALSFNDAWIERARSQAAWIEVVVDGEVRIPKLVGDGVLVSTAPGSTAYARSMGAMPLPAETPALLLVGSNVMSPPNWKSALLSLDAQVEFTGLDTDKRPLNGFAGGFSQGEVTAMRIRLSRIAAVELAFSRNHDMAEKIARIQFPKSTES
ncbi:MAG: hypothetical protein C5B54_08990 [Acidobacteria bacterium]|nr:MAG: hypothetical protein C5B54_08990 [Acidobacteriota bacterium]